MSGWLEEFVPGPVVVRAGSYAVPACNGQAVVFGTLSAAAVVTLPAAPVLGQVVIVKRVGAETETITIDGNGKTIEGAATYALSGDSASVFMIYSGVAWCVIGTYVTPPA